MPLSHRFIPSLTALSESDQEKLSFAADLFCSIRFLEALEQSGCCSKQQGWQPHHLALYRDDALIGLVPLYLKQHSYGEYVFDWRWAQSYQYHGLPYYPKLLWAIPFTPVTGARMILLPNESAIVLLPYVIDALKEECKNLDVSGWHLLFSDNSLHPELESHSLLHRCDVQFHWLNRGYGCFDDFLIQFRASKRKQLRRERSRVQEQGIQIERKQGKEISESDWSHFFECYQSTYARRSGHGGYLNRSFFQHLASQKAQNIMMVIASRQGSKVAAALFFQDQQTLYGRYWGCLEEVDSLHFECCYYQGIEHAITHNLHSFNPGTQGEHKLARGFEPVLTHSYHWLRDTRFHRAIETILPSERRAMQAYQEECRQSLPFHRSS